MVSERVSKPLPEWGMQSNLPVKKFKGAAIKVTVRESIGVDGPLTVSDDYVTLVCRTGLFRF